MQNLRTSIAVATSALLTVSGPTAAQSAAARLNMLGSENGALARRIGLWDVVETVWNTPNAAPVVTRALVAERRMVGTVLQETLRSASDRAGTILRTDYLSFNRVQGRWEYVSMDTRAPVGIMPAASFDRGRDGTILLTFEPLSVAGPGSDVTGQMLRMTQAVILQDADHDHKDQTFIMADGTGRAWLAHRYAYTRRN